jgi:serralysin
MSMVSVQTRDTTSRLHIGSRLSMQPATSARTQAAAVSSAHVSISAAGMAASLSTGNIRLAVAVPVNYTDRVKASANAKINALLAGGNRWWHDAGGSGVIPSAVAKHTLTYSFIADSSGLTTGDANGFQALDSSQQDVVRQALDYISSVVDITFTEVSSGGDLQYGSNSQTNSAAYARYPNEGSQVFLANNQSTFQGSWSAGSYEWETILHETGHALGLKHPGNYNAGGGGTPGPYLAASLDNRNNTIMSYRDAATTKRIGYANGMFQTSTVNPDTYQALDIAALQYLYGAANSQAATFQWSDGQAMQQTIFNNNSASVLDLSNQTGTNVLDLRAGAKSSIGLRDAYADMPFTKAQYAALTSNGRKLSSLLGVPTYTGANNLTIAAGSTINNAVGGSGKDTIVLNANANTVDAGAGDDAFFVTTGNATLTGGNGDDTVYVTKKAGAVWTLSSDNSTLTLSKTDARTHVVTTLQTLNLSGIEHIKYWNGSALKPMAGTPILGAPLPNSPATLAYAPPPAAGSRLSTAA